MKGFALILAFLVLEAAFLWQALAPRRAAGAVSAPTPLVVRGAQEARDPPGRASPSARWADDVRCPTRTFAVEGRRAGFAL